MSSDEEDGRPGLAPGPGAGAQVRATGFLSRVLTVPRMWAQPTACDPTGTGMVTMAQYATPRPQPSPQEGQKGQPGWKSGDLGLERSRLCSCAPDQSPDEGPATFPKKEQMANILDFVGQVPSSPYCAVFDFFTQKTLQV